MCVRTTFTRELSERKWKKKYAKFLTKSKGKGKSFVFITKKGRMIKQKASATSINTKLKCLLFFVKNPLKNQALDHDTIKIKSKMSFEDMLHAIERLIFVLNERTNNDQHKTYIKVIIIQKKNAYYINVEASQFLSLC